MKEEKPVECLEDVKACSLKESSAAVMTEGDTLGMTGDELVSAVSFFLSLTSSSLNFLFRYLLISDLSDFNFFLVPGACSGNR